MTADLTGIISSRLNGTEAPASLDDWDPGDPPPVDGQHAETPADREQQERAEQAPRQIALRPLHEIVAEEREPEWLIHNVLEASVLAVLAGARSTFKSFIALHWAMLIAQQDKPVAYLSGEGAGLDRRGAAWMMIHGRDLDLTQLPVVALETALNLTLNAELTALAGAFAALPRPPVLVVIDTLSKFSPGADENNNSEMATFLARLSEGIRDAFGCSVLLVAHSGHGDAKRPRGASALMANPDAEYIVERPNPTAMTVTISRERFKDGAALPLLGYEARVVPLGRVDRYGEPVTSLVLESTDAPVVAAKGKAAGKNQQIGMTVLREWARTHTDLSHIPTDQIVAMFKTQGISHKRRPEVLTWLTGAGLITPSIGGFTLNREAL